MAVEIFRKIEEGIFGKSTWATESMTFAQRLKFFRDTGEWPGVYSREATAMFMQSNIDAERAEGKQFCANQKLKRAKEAGLKVK